MKIVLSGVETNNKGAELMLYAILQEIERKWPDAVVYIPYSRCKQGLEYVKTKVKLRLTPFSRLECKLHLSGIFWRLHLPIGWLGRVNIVDRAEWFLDGSGFAFSDQFNFDNGQVEIWKYVLAQLKKQGCKIIFLPQAFGPVEKKNTKQMFNLINNNASLIMPREEISYNYIKHSGVVGMEKVKIYPDFTSLVEGVFPTKYACLKDGICIIPNMQMINKGTISYSNYILFLSFIIDKARNSKHPIYLLNHEGEMDEQLAYRCKESVGNDIEVVTGLDALEVKGLISSAYMVITSRFHGLASALNCCVPALATSWSHKYEELFKNYDLSDCLLPLNDNTLATQKIEDFMEEKKNQEIRKHLLLRKNRIQEESRKMWNEIWKL